MFLRLPFLSLPVQGDDVYYLLIAENARIDPLHPMDFSFRLQGETVWAAGHTRPPLAGLLLAGLIEVFGEVDVVKLHLVYLGLSLVAVWSMYWLARRFTDRPLWAGLLFAAVPAFVVNGTKLEADLPLLALWTLGCAAFANQRYLLGGCALALAGFTGYQAFLAVPILLHLVWYERRSDRRAWAAALAAPALAVAWQVFERLTTGTAPAEVLGGYAGEYGLLALERKFWSSMALLGHLGWVVSPLVVIVAWRGRRIAASLGVGAALSMILPADYSSQERLLFALSAGCGLALLGACAELLIAERERDGGFLASWVVVFFLGSLALFYAGSARYLLPLAPAAVLVAVRAARSNALLAGGVALNLGLGLALAASEHRYARDVQAFVEELAPLTEGRRVWSNAEWGLRYALAQIGGEPLLAGQTVPTGAVLVESTLAAPVPHEVEGTRRELLSAEARMTPLRTAGVSSHAGYSSSEFGVLPFAFSGNVVETMTAWRIGLPEATRSYLSLADPPADEQILSGFYPSDGADWRWMRAEAAAVLKIPEGAKEFRFEFHIPEDAPAREVWIEVDGVEIARERYEETGGHVLAGPASPQPGSTARVVLRADKAYSPPGDDRELALVAVGFGFR